MSTLAQSIGPANANATAQRTGEGIGIQNIRRGVAKAEIGGLGSDITVSATTFGALSTPLSLEIDLSGRPLRVALTGVMSAGSGGELVLDVTLRGVSITGGRMVYSGSTGVTTLHAEEIVMRPAPGRATLAVVGVRATADGTVYAQDPNRLVLTAVEL